jgi:hypothetical protein
MEENSCVIVQNDGGFFFGFFFLRAPVLAFLRFPLIFAKFSEIQSEFNWT